MGKHEQDILIRSRQKNLNGLRMIRSPVKVDIKGFLPNFSLEEHTSLQFINSLVKSCRKSRTLSAM